MELSQFVLHSVFTGTRQSEMLKPEKLEAIEATVLCLLP